MPAAAPPPQVVNNADAGNANGNVNEEDAAHVNHPLLRTPGPLEVLRLNSCDCLEDDAVAYILQNCGPQLRLLRLRHSKRQPESIASMMIFPSKLNQR